MLQQHQQQPKAAYRGMYMPPGASGALKVPHGSDGTSGAGRGGFAARAEAPSQPPPRRPPMPHPDDSQKTEDAVVGGGGGGSGGGGGDGGGDYFAAMMEKALAQGAFPEGQVPSGLM